MRYFMFFVFFTSLCSFSQTAKVSSFSYDMNNAMVLAMKSNYDTIILDLKPTIWVFSPLKIWNARNKVLILEPGVEIRARKHAYKKKSSSLLQFIHCENIKIIGNEAILSMNKEEYVDGEWRHAISLRACNNMTIQDLTVRDSGGDGIYIAGWDGKETFSENIILDNIKSINNKRQGVSIISAKKVRITNSTFAETKGTLPGAGLDIEPNYPENRIEEIVIKDCVFRDNYHAGIMLGLGRMRSWSTPVSIRIENAILENNHASTHPKAAAEIIIGANKDDPVKGQVTFENCVIRNSKWGLFYSRKRADAFLVSFIDCTAINICKDGSWPPIFLEVPDYREKTGPLGGYSFSNFYIEQNGVGPFMTVRGSRLGTLEALAKIQGDVTILSNATENYKYINYSPDSNKEVNLKITRKFH